MARVTIALRKHWTGLHLLHTPCQYHLHRLYSTHVRIDASTPTHDDLAPLDPSQDYTSSPFVDARPLTLISGNGGNGCVSFVREKYIPQGPPNGGDGGVGGSVYIQAIFGESVSLHKLARGIVRASNGRHGMGKARNGARGDDVVLRVPVGTVVREIERSDPNDYENAGGPKDWVHFPLAVAENLNSEGFARSPWPKRHFETARDRLKATHPSPVLLDLDKPTPEPILLLPGAPGGYGNPHFVTQSLRAPKFATKGAKGLTMKITLELKLLADVGLVGLPNAGKSSFLRAVSRKKARVGNWAFTTLSPNLGTVVLPQDASFTIADIPGLIAGAHLNKGLGLGFLRHVERARVLAFVIDLENDPIADLIALWKELVAYEEGWEIKEGGMTNEMMGATSEEDSMEKLGSLSDVRDEDIVDECYEEEEDEDEVVVKWTPPVAVEQDSSFEAFAAPPQETRARITTKPFIIIANKADLPSSQENFKKLKEFLRTVRDTKDKETSVGILGMIRAMEEGLGGEEPVVYPICAKDGGGVESVVDSLKALLKL